MHKFDTWILSYEVGVMKPDPEIFRIALLKAGVGADETIFIDDIRGMSWVRRAWVSTL